MVDQSIRQENVGVDPHWLELPEDIIRQGIEAMPPGERQNMAYSDWARARILKGQQNPDPVSTAVDYGRAALRGIPGVGSFVDEATAGINAANPFSPTTYSEAIPYWRQRDQQFADTHPATEAAGQLVGGVAVPPLARGVGAGASMLYNTILGAVGGFGRGEGSPLTEEGVKSRFGNAAAEAAGTGVLSTLFGPTSRYVNRFAASNVTPEVQAALDRLNINATPYFVRSADEMTQAQGRRAAQVNVGTPLNSAYGDTRDQFGRAAGDVVRGTAGVAPDTAPWTTGQTIDTALRRSAEGAQRSRGVLADEINRQMPPGAQFDPAAQRAAVRDVVSERASTGMVNPERGLGDHLSFATAPTTWEGSNAYTTRLGQAVGLPQTDASDVARSELKQLYAGHQGVDRPNFVEQVLGPAGRARFEQSVAEQERMGNLQRDISAMLRANATPEQLVAGLFNSGSLKGPTNLNAFNLIMGSLSPSERQQAAAGVLSHIVNQNQVQTVRGSQVGTATNPGAVANAINRLAPIARDALYPRGTQLGGDVDALRLVGQRIGQVNQFQNVGSAATLGKTMQQAPVVGSTIRSILGATGLPQAKTGLDNLLLQYGLPPGVASIIDRLGTTGARMGGEAAAPYVQGAAPHFLDQLVQLKSTLPGAPR